MGSLASSYTNFDDLLAGVVMSSDLIKFFVTLATKIVDAADGMVNIAGSIPAITAAISGVLSVMQMSGKLKNGAGKVNMPSYICCV